MGRQATAQRLLKQTSNVASLASNASQLFQVWCRTSDRRNFPPHVGYDYMPFWSALSIGLFQAVVNNCSMIQDRAKNTHNLDEIIDGLILLNTAAPVPLKDFRAQLREIATPIQKRVTKYRNVMTAHRSSHPDHVDRPTRVDFDQEELGELVEIYCRITNSIWVDFFGQRSKLDDKPATATDLLVADLAMFCAARPRAAPKSVTTGPGQKAFLIFKGWTPP